MSAARKPAPAGSQFAYVLLFFTSLFWGGNAVAGKLAVGEVSPMTLTALRWVIAFSIMLAIGGRQFWRERHAALPRLPPLFAYGATGFATFNVLFYVAANHTSAINIAIEQAAIPMFIFILNFLIFRMRVTPGQMVGFVMSLVGVAMVASNGSLARLLALEINRGDAFMLLACLVYAGYSVGLRYKPELHWKTMMVVMAFSAMVVSFPFAFIELRSPQGIAPTAQGWLVILYAAIFPAIIAQVFYIGGVDMIGSNRAGLFVNLVPVLGTLLAIAILGEVFGLHHALAMVLVIGGIWLAERRASAARPPGK
ncbi:MULTISPECIES: DMT family transporter [unclassified Roseitalea]|uniref:DMT family transporter n=1 Tax=unclassified Roseitalea TaxID=2639107 RepID=UPI00273D3DD3|nr:MULTISPECIES: DMT family transporter [unclassified Roseitalea]